ncbi:MAG TPA: CHAP domain-containing protein [Conexibacter sp.]|nr:CHAP domain-containing protein [Conexibacter sp.]
MSLALALARIDQIDQAFAPPAPPTPAAAAASPAATTASVGSFASALQGALPTNVLPSLAMGSRPPAPAIVAAAEGEVGQAEQPPGSNDSPRIAMYRQATVGSGVGPWCAYFASWAARQAGMPLGDQGQGFGSVDALYAWAQRTGRAQSNGPGVVPRPGDLIVFHEHVGIVEGVLPDGRIQTIEGNSSDRVSRNVHGTSDAVGYVRMS